MITDLDAFIRYFHGQRRRTQWVVDRMPADKWQWTPWPNEPSPAHIICRAAAGHLMYATVIAHDYWVVDAYEEAATSGEEAVAYFEKKTEAALDLLRPLPNSVLKAKRRKPNANIPSTAWRFLMAMLDHEIQHRTQLNTYLMLLNVDRPSMDAVSIEAVRASLEAK